MSELGSYILLQNSQSYINYRRNEMSINEEKKQWQLHIYKTC